MQMLKATADFSSVESSPLLLKARLSEIVYVELEITAIH